LHLLNRSNASANRQRHEATLSDPFDDIDHGRASMGTGGYIEENQFVRALIVIPDGQFDRITYVTQFAGFGFAKLNAAGDMSIVDVQTWNNALCQHYWRKTGDGETLSSVSRPVSELDENVPPPDHELRPQLLCKTLVLPRAELAAFVFENFSRIKNSIQKIHRILCRKAVSDLLEGGHNLGFRQPFVFCDLQNGAFQ
jgi:hypothetical protein